MKKIKTKNYRLKIIRKKHLSKKIWALIIFIVCVIVLIIAMIYTGCWNPNKSTKISTTAKEKYTEQTESKALINSVNPDWKSYFGPNDDYPYGCLTEDYGIDRKMVY